MFSGRLTLGYGVAVVLGLAALGGPVAGGATAAAPVRRHHTVAGMAQARAVLLHRRDLGRGWSAAQPADPKPQPLTCPEFNPPLGRSTETGSALSPQFSQSDDGPFVSQTAFAYATAAQGRNVARTIIRTSLMRCLAGSLVGESTSTLTFKVSHQRRLAIRLPGNRAARYRISGTASQPYQTVDVYLDAIVIARGRVVTEVSFASFLVPPPRRLELHAARVIARRLLRASR